MNAPIRDVRTAAPWPAPPTARKRRPLERVWHALVTQLVTWRNTRRAIARLSAFSDLELRDMGVTRCGIPWAARQGRRQRPEPGTVEIDQMLGAQTARDISGFVMEARRGPALSPQAGE